MKLLLCLVYSAYAKFGSIKGLEQSFKEYYAHPLSVIEHMNEMKGMKSTKKNDKL